MFGGVTLMVLSVVVARPQSAPEPLKFVRAIKMLKVEGKFDHYDVDLKNQRLFAVATGNQSVETLICAPGSGCIASRDSRSLTPQLTSLF